MVRARPEFTFVAVVPADTDAGSRTVRGITAIGLAAGVAGCCAVVVAIDAPLVLAGWLVAYLMRS